MCPALIEVNAVSGITSSMVPSQLEPTDLLTVVRT